MNNCVKVVSHKLLNLYPEFAIGFGKGVELEWRSESSEVFVLSTRLFFFS